jgi:thioesterase domain-containing protein
MTSSKPADQQPGRDVGDWAARVAALPAAKRALLAELTRRRAAASVGGTDPLADTELLRAAAGPGTGDPIVLAHPIGGSLFCYASLCQTVRPGRAIWGVAAGRALAEPGEFTIEQLAQRYVAKLAEANVPRPAVVAGWSFGGLLAYEMARCWHATARLMPPVLLIDAVPWSRSLPPWDQQTTLRTFAEYLLDLASQSLDLSADPALWRLPVPDALAAAARAVRERGADLGLSGQELVGRYWMYANAAQAMSRYRPGAYSGRVTLIQTAEAAEAAEADLWPRGSVAKLSVLCVPGDHYSVLRPPVVDKVARALSEAANADDKAMPAGPADSSRMVD